MDSISAIQDLYDQDGLLDILLGVEKYFDDMDLYAYENWIHGVLVEGPIVSKYWVEVTFKYDAETYPDPVGAKLFEAQGTKVFVRCDYETVPIKHPRSREDMKTVAAQGNAISLPREERIPIILYKFQIPRRIVNPESFDEYKLMSSVFNQNPQDDEQPVPDISMEDESEVEEMDSEFNQPQQGGM